MGRVHKAVNSRLAAPTTVNDLRACLRYEGLEIVVTQHNRLTNNTQSQQQTVKGQIMVYIAVRVLRVVQVNVAICACKEVRRFIVVLSLLLDDSRVAAVVPIAALVRVGIHIVRQVCTAATDCVDKALQRAETTVATARG